MRKLFPSYQILHLKKNYFNKFYKQNLMKRFVKIYIKFDKLFEIFI